MNVGWVGGGVQEGGRCRVGGVVAVGFLFWGGVWGLGVECFLEDKL